MSCNDASVGLNMGSSVLYASGMFARMNINNIAQSLGIANPSKAVVNIGDWAFGRSPGLTCNLSNSRLSAES